MSTRIHNCKEKLCQVYLYICHSGILEVVECCIRRVPLHFIRPIPWKEEEPRELSLSFFVTLSHNYDSGCQDLFATSDAAYLSANTLNKLCCLQWAVTEPTILCIMEDVHLADSVFCFLPLASIHVPPCFVICMQ